MLISEIQSKQGKVIVIGKITEKGEVRSFEKFGKPGRVCSARIKDESVECTLSLWNEQIDQVNEGDKIKIENGYANEWQGAIQLSTGRFGKIEIIEANPKAPKKSAQKKEDELDISEEDLM